MDARSQALRLIVLSALIAWGSPAIADITGQARVIDGDTIDIHLTPTRKLRHCSTHE